MPELKLRPPKLHSIKGSNNKSLITILSEEL